MTKQPPDLSELFFAVPAGTKQGSLQYLKKLHEAWGLHLRKSAGYAGHSDDAWINFRTAKLGVPDELGIAVRLNDKFNRLVSLLQNEANDQVNEPLEDLYRDIAAYCLIALCIREERGMEAAALPFSDGQTEETASSLGLDPNPWRWADSRAQERGKAQPSRVKPVKSSTRHDRPHGMAGQHEHGA